MHHSQPDDLPPNAVLREAVRTGFVEHPDGRKVKLTSAISRRNLNALYRTVLARRPALVIEIGMAYGVSTLGILTALEELKHGELISIDPYLGWDGGMAVARHQVARSGLAGRHRHIRDSSHAALPKLLAEGLKPDLVYIDGWHTFDGAFVDFFYADKLIGVGGVVAFNDAGWRSVFRVIRFVQTHRKYRELDVGLPRCYRSRNLLFSLIKRIEGRSTLDRYFEKVEAWEPSFNYYRRF